MSSLPMRQRARLACGHTPDKYADGGMVVPGGRGLKAPQLVQRLGAPKVQVTAQTQPVKTVARNPRPNVRNAGNPLIKGKMRNAIKGG